ncbi:hypothetical protein ACA910_020658 [Epithemia clementina (nom. ined.)]
MTAFTNIARQAPRQVYFNSDSTEFLIDSGASYHIWSNRRAFTTYRNYSKEEQDAEVVLGITGPTTPKGVGQIQLRLEDDVGHIHQFTINDVRYLPQAPTNVLVPQMFAQQRASEGDLAARCIIDRNSLTLEWTANDGTPATKYIPLTKSNIGICRTAPGHTNFAAFAQCFPNFALPAPYVSDNEGDEGDMSVTGLDDETPRKSPLTMDFPTNSNVIPPNSADNDPPLRRSDERLLMEYHERLGHYPFALLKLLALNNVIPRKLAKCLLQNALAAYTARRTGNLGAHTSKKGK